MVTRSIPSTRLAFDAAATVSAVTKIARFRALTPELSQAVKRLQLRRFVKPWALLKRAQPEALPLLGPVHGQEHSLVPSSYRAQTYEGLQ